MRKHISVFMLYTRSSVFRLLILFVLMAAAELPMFFFAADRCLNSASVTLEQMLDNSGMTSMQTSVSLSLERMFDNSGIAIVLAAVFVLMSIQLCGVGCEFGSKQGYTLRRLSVSEETVFAWQASFNALAYFVLWGMQLMLVLVMCSYGVEKLGALASNQTVFLAFYRNKFLHSLLPLDEWSRYLRNICMILALGTASAFFSYNQRRKKVGLSMIVMLPVTVLGFCGSTGSSGGDACLTLFFIAVTGWCVYRVYGKEKNDED